MIILGLNHGEINSSAALVKDGELIAACPEERFTRHKNTKAFPQKAVEYCLSTLGIKLSDCDYIAQAWNPGAGWYHYNPLISGSRVRREDYFYTVPDHLHRFTGRKHKDWVLTQFPEEDGMPPIYYVTHHRAHAANAFYLSQFEDAAILTADFKGEFESATMCHGKGNKIEVLASMYSPHSLGMLYSTFTELLGYRVDNDEWKVMALSAFDMDIAKEYEAARRTIKFLDNGFIELDQSFYKGAIVDQPKLYTEKLMSLMGGREGYYGEPIDDWHIKVAKVMQKLAEEIAVHMLKTLYELTKCENVVVSGGFFMNSVFNGKIAGLTSFKNIFVPYAPNDSGNSIGGALYAAHHIHDESRVYKHNPSDIGPSFENSSAVKALQRRKLNYSVVENRAQTIAELLSQGNIVAVMSGRAEFGDRALGNRSILADPRRSDIKDKINAMIKYRESYRPFAPVTTIERVAEYFDVDNSFDCYYMEKVVPVRKQYREILPAVTHVDGSGRVQTVNKDYNREFYDIVEEFGKRTGIPVVLNTSFNINGEPIVLTPDDALNTFFNSGLEHLLIGNCYIKK